MSAADARSAPHTRTEKELIEACRPLAAENRAKSWFAVLSTLAIYAALLGVAWTPSLHWAIRLTGSVLAGLTTVRMFILYHDFLHGAILRRSKVGKALFYVYGLLVLTPPNVWRDSHNYHHANTAKIVGSHVGSYAMVTTAMWAKMSAKDQRMYRMVRHPLTIALGYFTLFTLGMCVSPLRRAPKKNWMAALALVANWTASALILWKLGVVTYVLGFFLPLAIAMAVGGYLFYAQHNFPDMYVQPREGWSYARAALESSSYMRMGPVMEWFTGSIGYHHVHHLNQMIPFYRLREAMEAIPELQHPRETSLAPKDVIDCFRQKLWDPDAGRMVGYPRA